MLVSFAHQVPASFALSSVEADVSHGGVETGSLLVNVHFSIFVFLSHVLKSNIIDLDSASI